MEPLPARPREAVIKEDLLRGGIAFDDSALSDNEGGEVKPKSYFIFSFDQKPLPELGEAALRRPPEEIVLTGGPYDLRRTVVSVRVNPDLALPRRAPASDGGARALPGRAAHRRRRRAADAGVLPAHPRQREVGDGGRPHHPVGLPDLPDRLPGLPVLRRQGGVPVLRHQPQLAPAQGGGPPVHGREAGRGGAGGAGDHRPVRHRRSLAPPTRSPAGRSPRSVDGRDEADFYGHYAKAIEERFPGRWIGKVVAQALPKDDVQRFKDYGDQIYHPNYEVWDKRLFELYCPGKERYVGRDEWHRRILDSAEVFGPAQRDPQLRGRRGDGRSRSASPRSTRRSTPPPRGCDFFMSRGITPRFTTWCPEPTTPLGKANPQGAPLEYHIRLLEAYRATMERVRPRARRPATGRPGAGNARSSRSARSWTRCGRTRLPARTCSPARPESRRAMN